MSPDAERFARDTSAEIARGQFRADAAPRVRLASTEWTLSHLEPWEYRALATFLLSLVERPPINGDAFAGHRTVLTALASDLTAAFNEESDAV